MDNLFNTLLVVEDPDPLTDEQLQAVLKSFDDYKLLIVDYLKNYYDNANIKQSYCIRGSKALYFFAKFNYF